MNPPQTRNAGDSSIPGREEPRPAAYRDLLLTGTLLVYLALSCGTTGCRTATGPNVLVVVLDTARADRCSFLGYDRPTTPRLEEFARDAVTFEEAWSPASWTSPAHATLFTGLHPESHGLRMGSSDVLAPEFPTLAGMLSDAGYATACFSNNPHVSSDLGLTRGFGTEVAFHRRKQRSLPLARETLAETAAWIESCDRDGRPFFAFVNLMEAHVPRDPPDEVARRFLRPGLAPAAIENARGISVTQVLAAWLGSTQFSDEERAALSDLYDAMMSVADAEVGTLLDGLRASGVLDRTLVIVTSDHGEGLGDHGWLAHAVRLDRELLRVPLLARLPGTFGGGRVVRDVARLEDVMPTVLLACGVPPPRGLDGSPLQAIPPGRFAWAVERPYTHIATTVLRANPQADIGLLRFRRRSIFDGALHLIEEEGSGPRLHDTAADPRERRDLSAARPDDLARLRQALDSVTGTSFPK